MNSQVAVEAVRSRARSFRTYAVSALGPLTVLAGIVWALAQPYRLTLLHPRGEGFWELLIESPLLVVAVGLIFAVGVAPGLLEDLEAAQEEGA